MSSLPTLNQLYWRSRTDAAGVNSTPTWGADQDCSFYPGLDVNFRVRFKVNNTGAASAAGPFILRSSKNGAAYAAVTTSSTGGIQSANASSDADETAIPTANFQLTAGGTTSAGVYDETGSATLSLAVSSITEIEYGVALRAANLAACDVVDLRLYNSTTVFAGSYRATPAYCVPEAAGTNFAPDKNLGTGGNNASSTTVVLNSAAAVASGKLVVVCYACDNIQATDGDENLVTAMSDNAGNTYTKAAEYTKGGGLAAEGVATGIWYCRLSNAISVGTVITATLGSARVAKAITARSWTVGGAVSVEATAGLATTAGGNPSHNATTANIECLRVNARGYEGVSIYDDVGPRLHPTGWSALNGALGGYSAGSVLVAGYARISTGTGDACDPVEPTLTYDSSSVYVAFKVADTEDDLLANDVISTSSVSPAPQLRQEQAVLANDVKSNSSVSQPAFAVIVPNDALLANDVVSASSVSQPAATILRGLLANDVKSNSSVSQPAVKALHGLLANDVKSNSSVGQPAAVIGRGLLANDVTSGSSVSNPALTEIAGATALQANDVLSASSVSQPAALIRWNILANDIASNSSVGQPALHTLQGLLANDVVSPSSVSVPLFGEIAAGSLLSENVTSASSVTSPALHLLQDLLAADVTSGSSVSQPMLDRPEVVVPPLPTGGASAGGYGYYRRRRPEDEEEYQREREKREERIRDLARVIDRAIAKAQGEIADELPEAVAAPLAEPSAPELIAIDDALETIQERVRAIEDLGSRILEADAEFEALRQEAIALMIEAELDDDDEALELLLAA